MKKIRLIRLAAWALLWSGLGYGGPLSAAEVVPSVADSVFIVPSHIQMFDCAYNRVTSLDVSGCDSLRTLHAEYNRLSLPACYTLSRPLPSGTRLYLSPQTDTCSVSLAVEEEWNLGSFLQGRLPDIAGRQTEWKLTADAGTELSEAQYSHTDGSVRFHQAGFYWLVLTNAAVCGSTDWATVGPVEYRFRIAVGIFGSSTTVSVGGGRLTYLDVDGGDVGHALTALRIPDNGALSYLRVSGNRLPLSALADLLVRRQERAEFRLDPQSDSVRLALEEVWDLGSEWRIGGTATQWTLYPKVAGMNRRYTCSSDGVFLFHEPGNYRLELKNDSVCDYNWGSRQEPVTFTYYITVTGTRPGDTTANEAGLAHETGIVYTRGRTICLSEDMGEVCVYTQAGQKVYEGRAMEIPVTRAGFYVVQAGNRRFKVVVR
ncbi:MAG: hypothetical protein K2O01_06280 [Bacteroidales bacterium]|nr:hypothetical protein [Bacteroidales bacterium]